MSGQYVRKQYPTNNYLESLAVYFERRLDTAFEGPDGAGSVETDICADIAKKIRSLKTHGASSTHRQGPETIPAMYTGDDITVIGKLIITDENRQQYLIAAVKEWQTTFKVEPLLDVLRELIIKSDASKVAMYVGAGVGCIDENKTRADCLLDDLTDHLDLELFGKLLKYFKVSFPLEQ